MWYEVFGHIDARPIVLLHGSTLTGNSWLPQVEALQEEYRLIVPDLPGHGALGDEPFIFERAVENLHKLVEREGNGCALVVGISLGGHIATRFASLYRHHTAGLVLSGASMDFHGLTGSWVRFSAWMMLRLFSKASLQRKLEKSIRKKWPADYAEAQIAAGLWPYGAAQSFRELPRYDFQALLRSVRAPVLILNGEFDRLNRKHEAVFAAAAPNARLAVVPGAGHACSIEQPLAYTEHLRAFAREIGWLSYQESRWAAERRQQVYTHQPQSFS
jgi:pimeloyl-ACP methyl ester carboxylesterase